VQKASLYRHFDAEGRLLYVGISKNAVCRLNGHQSKSWYDDLARVEIEKHPSRDHALYAESVAIRVENPLYNIERPERLHPDIARKMREARARAPLGVAAKAFTPNVADHQPIATVVYAAIPSNRDGCESACANGVFAIADFGQSRKGLIRAVKQLQRPGRRLETNAAELFAPYAETLRENGVALMVWEHCWRVQPSDDPSSLIDEVERRHNRVYRRAWRAKRKSQS
jgi:hypothetical protein